MAHAHQHPDTHRHRVPALGVAFALTCLMLVAEAAGGWWSNSLALLADAGHMLVDAASLLLAWTAAYFATRPADARRSFGYARLEVLSGFVNALVQVLLVAWIVYEAVHRLLELGGTEIRSGVMLAVALAGLLVNAIVLRMLHARESDDLNTAAASLHVFGDLLGSLATVAAALLVRYLRWDWADPALSLLVSLYVGLEGQGLRIAALSRRGWRQWGVVEADSLEDAEVRQALETGVAVEEPAPVPRIVPDTSLARPAQTGMALGLTHTPGRP